MTYVISDIHGCYAEYLELLKKINFSNDDELYILGDVIDRGKEPVKLLLDLMERTNVYLLLGNHEFMMLEAAGGILSQDITSRSIEELENNIGKLQKALESMQWWIKDGGDVTWEQYRKLPADVRRDITDYISDSLIYEDLSVCGKRFILAHAGLHGFDGDFTKLTIADICMYRTDYSKRYFDDENTFLITGHTPVPFIRNDNKPVIYEENGHIAIDCACVFGGRLAAYCLETGEKFYVNKIKE